MVEDQGNSQADIQQPQLFVLLVRIFHINNERIQSILRCCPTRGIAFQKEPNIFHHPQGNYINT